MRRSLDSVAAVGLKAELGGLAAELYPRVHCKTDMRRVAQPASECTRPLLQINRHQGVRQICGKTSMKGMMRNHPAMNLTAP